MSEHNQAQEPGCPECAAPLVNGMTCWEMLGAIIAWGFDQLDRLTWRGGRGIASVGRAAWLDQQQVNFLLGVGLMLHILHNSRSARNSAATSQYKSD